MKRIALAGALLAGLTNFTGACQVMPGPYHEYSRQQAAEQVSKAYREGLVRDPQAQGCYGQAIAGRSHDGLDGRLFGGGGGI
jgi:hypothetical protein